ncbi:hypothetical protein Lsai_3358 [Legionella sainthelensi]|uniref:Uncharacterized protein n=1 Tax=Legionella sainthelensi TaxID=28087 RepID=A0A0W0YC52_9GAMM|nr:hypothetical protein [Legionella sainthelensi]KTD54536.1 hypothetical protein Lsai_3358 [Legionella sainthelensi]VEH33660.1 Uncharacterised protein [Legionella sainthelensi]
MKPGHEDGSVILEMQEIPSGTHSDNGREFNINPLPNYHTFEPSDLANTAIYNVSPASLTTWLTRYLPSPSSLTRYLPSWSTVAYGTAAFATTLPFLPYVLTKTPASLGADWWAGLDLNTQLYLIGSSAIFLAVGTGTRFSYYQHMVASLKKIAGSFCTNSGNFLSNSTIMLISTISAMPSGAMGYYAASWAPQALSGLSALSSFCMTSAVRLVFLPNFFTMIKDKFNEDRQFQKQIITQLSLINKQHPSALAWIGPADQTFDDELIQDKLGQFYQQLLDQPDLLAPFCSTRLSEFVTFLTTTGTGAWLSTAFFIFCSQAGYDGFKLICQLLLDNCPMDELHYAAKLAIAITPGITAGIVAFMSGYEFPDHIIGNVFVHVKQKPVDLLKTLLITGCCALTALALKNAATSLASHPNLFNLTPNGTDPWEYLYYALYVYGNYGTGMVLDLTACTKLLGLTENTHPTSADTMITWLEKNSLPPETLSALKKHSFFNHRSDTPNSPKNELIIAPTLP